jgi:glucosyl-dolichyl phosphate glucuronosyltransferase
MQLDIIVATRNRAELLAKLLDSIRRAGRPPGLDVRVIVVDNGSTDGTPDVVRACEPIHGVAPTYLRERRPGKSNALNRGLAEGAGDLVGLVDDDEEIDAAWLAVIADTFRDPAVDFISGPCQPNWGARPPKWLPRAYPAVIGWIDSGDRVRKYGDDYDGIMMGGNGVVRRRTIDQVGRFNPRLGRTLDRPMMCEDADYHERLMAAGARGYYVPRLVIYHFVPPDRLTRRYHRRWCFHRGISLAEIDRERPQAVAYVLGVPRYLFGAAARATLDFARAVCRFEAGSEGAFTSELRLWDLAGFAYGKWWSGRRRHRDVGDVEAAGIESQS